MFLYKMFLFSFLRIFALNFLVMRGGLGNTQMHKTRKTGVLNKVLYLTKGVALSNIIKKTN